MKQFLARSGPVGVIVCLFGVSLASLTLSRAILVAISWAGLHDVADLWRVFRIGFGLDTLVVCELFAIPALLYFAMPGERLRRRVALASFTIIAALLVHMELSTPNFIAEYGTRPN